MGGVFLALTGAEALYADMGHVGPTAIRRAWFGLVLPALLLNYFGQGALVLTDPHAVDSPFYKLAPHWALIPLVGLAALATIIASQALISGVFSLSRQAMQMGLCPRMRIVPTSSDEAGQIYVPTANWLLMAGTLLVVVLFKTSDNLAGAYGIAVSGTMLITTILLYRVAITRWKWPPAFAVLIIVVFGAIDSIFLASNSLKIFEGGWFPITVGGAMVGLMLCWQRGSSLVHQRLQEMSMPLQQFIDNIDNMVVARPPGMGVWLTKVAHGASPVLLHHVKHNNVMHKTLVLMTFVADRRPRVPFGERHSIEAPRPRHLSHPGSARLHADAGYPPDAQELPDAGLQRRSRARALLYRARDRRPPRKTVGDGGGVRLRSSRSSRVLPAARRTSSRFPTDGLSEVGFRIEI